MKTFREFFDKYLEANPPYFKKTSIDIIRRSGTAFKVIEDEPYDLVPTEVLDTIIKSMISDYARTKCAFIVRELDRLAAAEACKDKIIHPHITQRKAIVFAITNNQAYKDANIHSIALEENGKQELTFGYALLRLLTEKETVSSKACIRRLRWAASKFEKLYDIFLNNISDNDLQKVLSTCPESTIVFCNQLLSALHLYSNEEERGV